MLDALHRITATGDSARRRSARLTEVGGTWDRLADSQNPEDFEFYKMVLTLSVKVI